MSCILNACSNFGSNKDIVGSKKYDIIVCGGGCFCYCQWKIKSVLYLSYILKCV